MSGVLGLPSASSININHQIQPLARGGVAAQSLNRVRLCVPMACSTPGSPVLHHFPELAQTHMHWVGDAIQSSHPKRIRHFWSTHCVQYEKAHHGCSKNVKLLSLHLPFPYCRLHDCGTAYKHLEEWLACSGSTASNCWMCSSRTKIYPHSIQTLKISSKQMKFRLLFQLFPNIERYINSWVFKGFFCVQGTELVYR